ncbi:hypothetical protein [Neorhodopirellula lusitana]|uniref:hypothetical protein n=1 Tax=Neorhodopirellula lusitana TaxID=445327 RepID=UPI0024B7DA3C|nr:hypothetical protein [Neorhodopirellula lusitana]
MTNPTDFLKKKKKKRPNFPTIGLREELGLPMCFAPWQMPVSCATAMASSEAESASSFRYYT